MQESEQQNLQFQLVVGSSLTKTSNPTSGISIIYRNLWIFGRLKNHCPVTAIARVLLSHENWLKMHQPIKKKKKKAWIVSEFKELREYFSIH